MARIGVFIERYTVANSREMGALMRFSHVAQLRGHHVDVLFRPDIYKIPRYDALYVRSLTDPLNAAYVAAETARLHGLRVLDDPQSIIVCCDKVHMYKRLQNAEVPMPETEFLEKNDVNLETAERILKRFGRPVVLKAPNSSFSMYVDRVNTADEFVAVGKKYLRRANLIVAQQFVRSAFDWRVGVLAGEPLYVCKYRIPRSHWKIINRNADGSTVEGRVDAYKLSEVPQGLLDTAVDACNAIGKSLYGVDIKQVGDRFLVIEVNDNPTIAEGEEDKASPKLYERIVSYLAGEWG